MRLVILEQKLLSPTLRLPTQTAAYPMQRGAAAPMVPASRLAVAPRFHVASLGVLALLLLYPATSLRWRRSVLPTHTAEVSTPTDG